jgi:hypothetical protein
MIDPRVYGSLSALAATQVAAGPFDHTGTILIATLWGPQPGQGFGSVMVPALASGATITLTVNETMVSGQSHIFGTIRQYDSAPAAGAQAGLTWNVTSITAGVSFVVTIRNVGSAATIATDYCFSYLCVN